jgi:hypothetical protein
LETHIPLLSYRLPTLISSQNKIHEKAEKQNDDIIPNVVHHNSQPHFPSAAATFDSASKLMIGFIKNLCYPSKY